MRFIRHYCTLSLKSGSIDTLSKVTANQYWMFRYFIMLTRRFNILKHLKILQIQKNLRDLSCSLETKPTKLYVFSSMLLTCHTLIRLHFDLMEFVFLVLVFLQYFVALFLFSTFLVFSVTLSFSIRLNGVLKSVDVLLLI